MKLHQVLSHEYNFPVTPASLHPCLLQDFKSVITTACLDCTKKALHVIHLQQDGTELTSPKPGKTAHAVCFPARLESGEHSVLLTRGF